MSDYVELAKEKDASAFQELVVDKLDLLAKETLQANRNEIASEYSVEKETEQE